MKVKTNVKTLKRAWRLLKDLGLENLLSGGKITVNVVELVDSLLEEGKLNEFCQTITGNEIDFEELELIEVAEVISGFFFSIKAGFQKVIPNPEG